MSSPEKNAEKKPTRRALTITPEQAELLQQARADAARAKQMAEIILAAVMRGHGVKVGALVNLSGTTLTVEVPDGE